MMIVALLAALAGFALLALATHRHGDRLPGTRQWRRPAGWALIALSVAAAFGAWGPVYGAIGGMGLLMLAAGANLLALNLTRR
ncbi:hypothetical protein ASG37_04355 [Sphingomonas sp. Leaf407]|uniref:DUF3325 family protein n=1 Tax=unclassified Sphingomonas TaxID=196159 RepID=UPI0006FDDEB6|nr:MULTISPECIES: DUF3325 family protein [unclassified Sphingomonas]KQN36915.1 hypothetical protein ASE97_10270 [Sphingomonas sp. Leaf42]KQT30342.1 hypothetical protein ASG37_04355 [Sphingomonas sp. Leaf407]